MLVQEFDRSKHVYTNDQFAELIKDSTRFFSGTPVHYLEKIKTIRAFKGSGVYAIYYIGGPDEQRAIENEGLYMPVAAINRQAFVLPIYVGKAVPKGSRQSRITDDPGKQSSELCSRIKQHANSLLAANFDLSRFCCRFMIFEGESSNMIGSVEAMLIRMHQPLWNSIIDGFGNHDPGAGRYNQKKSDWDILHPGREWATKCLGDRGNDVENVKQIAMRVDSHLRKLTLKES